MISITLNTRYVEDFVSGDEIRLFERELDLHRQHIYERQGKGSDFLGWVDLPEQFDTSLIGRLEADAGRIQQQSDVVVVVGIGGSYLGARAVIEALSGNAAFEQSEKTEVVYAGHQLDEDYMAGLLSYLDDKDYSVIVISKSGTTTEPAIAFRLLRDHMEGKYGEDAAAGRIYAVTDARKGALKKLADNQGYTTYEIPDDVGGRYSVLTPVGLLPIAAAGYDIRKLLEGARQMAEYLRTKTALSDNPAARYAILRNILYKKGKTIEILTSYKSSLYYFIEWWKQLFGESEGKDGAGIFPAGTIFTTDLHSMGQYIQDGFKNMFETVLTVEKTSNTVKIPEDSDNLDGLNYLAGKRINHVNEMASRGTSLAHVDGGVPNLEIVMPAVNEHYLGELIYFFEMSCAVSGYVLGVNPFDQPGVEAYKRNMFALLGKPGFEEDGEMLRKRLQ